MEQVSPHTLLQWPCPLWLLRVAELGSHVPHLINGALGKDAGKTLCQATLERGACLHCAQRLYWGESGLSGLF